MAPSVNLCQYLTIYGMSLSNVLPRMLRPKILKSTCQPSGRSSPSCCKDFERSSLPIGGLSLISAVAQTDLDHREEVMRGTKVARRVQSDLPVVTAHNYHAQLLKAIGQKGTAYRGEVHTHRADGEIPLRKRWPPTTKKLLSVALLQDSLSNLNGQDNPLMKTEIRRPPNPRVVINNKATSQ